MFVSKVLFCMLNFPYRVTEQFGCAETIARGRDRQLKSGFREKCTCRLCTPFPFYNSSWKRKAAGNWRWSMAGVVRFRQSSSAGLPWRCSPSFSKTAEVQQPARASKLCTSRGSAVEVKPLAVALVLLPEVRLVQLLFNYKLPLCLKLHFVFLPVVYIGWEMLIFVFFSFFVDTIVFASFCYFGGEIFFSSGPRVPE